MAKRSVPVSRELPNSPVGTPITITPADGCKGCVVVEMVIDAEGHRRLNIALYVDADKRAEAGAVTGTYTEKTAANAWIVDLPYGLPDTTRKEIREAIINGPGKPNPPPPWG